MTERERAQRPQQLGNGVELIPGATGELGVLDFRTGLDDRELGDGLALALVARTLPTGGASDWPGPVGARNLHITATLVFGAGAGGTQSAVVDVGQGVQLAVPATFCKVSFSYPKVIDLPQPPVVLASAWLVAGNPDPAARPVLTGDSFEILSGGLAVLAVPAWARDVALYFGSIAAYAPAAVGVALLGGPDATDELILDADGQAFVGGRAVPLPGPAAFVGIANNLPVTLVGRPVWGINL